MIDLRPSLAEIVAEDEIPILGSDRRYAPIQTPAQGLLFFVVAIRCLGFEVFEVCGFNRTLLSSSGAEIFQKYEFCGDIAELRRRLNVDLADFVEATISAFEGFIGQFTGYIAALTLEISYKATAKSKIFLPLRFPAIVDPREKASERRIARLPLRLQHAGNAGFHHDLLWLSDMNEPDRNDTNCILVDEKCEEDLLTVKRAEVLWLAALGEAPHLSLRAGGSCTHTCEGADDHHHGLRLVGAGLISLR